MMVYLDEGNALEWAGDIINAKVGDRYGDEGKRLTIDDIEDVAEALMLYVRQQRGKMTLVRETE